MSYLYIQHTEPENDCVDPLQKFCRFKFGNFHSTRLFLCALGTIKKKMIELDRDFKRRLEMWNKPINMQQWTRMNKKSLFQWGNENLDMNWRFLFWIPYIILFIQEPKRDGKCQICVILIIFTGFEKDVEKNIFDYNFLFWYYIYTKLCKELIQLFDKKRLH